MSGAILQVIEDLHAITTKCSVSTPIHEPSSLLETGENQHGYVSARIKFIANIAKSMAKEEAGSYGSWKRSTRLRQVLQEIASPNEYVSQRWRGRGFILAEKWKEAGLPWRCDLANWIVDVADRSRESVCYKREMAIRNCLFERQTRPATALHFKSSTTV